MTAILEDKDRKMIPRWRDSRTTSLLREVDSFNILRPRNPGEYASLEKTRQDWLRERSFSFAADYVNASLVQGRRDSDALEAANYVLSRQGVTPSGAIQVARSLIEARNNTIDDPQLVGKDDRAKKIHNLRARLNNAPRNSILWADLSREYLILGFPEQAKRAMAIALNLTPDNRFILRAATRLYVHQGDLDHAQHLLSVSERLTHDPWLLSAEIAVSSAQGRTSRLAKVGRRMIDSENFSTFHLSELTSSLATLEMENGASRIAKKLFYRALDNPTENTVAQAEWASRRIDGLDVRPKEDLIPLNYEALARESYGAMDWAVTLQHSWDWLKDQPFSSRPVLLGSYVTSIALEDYAESRRLLGLGLVANPTDPILRNNLAYALACEGKIDEALKVFNSIDIHGADGPTQITLTATAGLLKYRQGKVDEGRALYLKALDKAKRAGSSPYSALVAAFLALQESIAVSKTLPESLALLSGEIKGQSFAGLNAVLMQINKRVGKKNLSV